jgi:hypothetical protein
MYSPIMQSATREAPKVKKTDVMIVDAEGDPKNKKERREEESWQEGIAIRERETTETRKITLTREKQ